MMAPIPPLSPSPPATADAHLPEMRIDVRVGSGRAVGYDLSRGEFLIGGADGCDLKLPGSHLPPVICQLARAADGLKLRRLAPAFPILLNGSPVSGSAAVTIGSGDRVAVGSADIVVSVNGKGHLRPSFHDLTRTKSTPTAPPDTARPDALAREREELDRYRAQVAEQAKELEADRVAWYRRRQEIEAEVRSIQQTMTAGTKHADREAWLQKREAEANAREQELARVREELTEIRQTLFDQYRERREQVEQMQQVVRGATSTFEERQTAYESDLARRRQELDRAVRRGGAG